MLYPPERASDDEDEDTSDTEFEVLAASTHEAKACSQNNSVRVLYFVSNLMLGYFGKGSNYVNFKAKLPPFIASHYHEDPERFSKTLDQLTHARISLAMRTREMMTHPGDADRVRVKERNLVRTIGVPPTRCSFGSITTISIS
ncbi:hypothetical protein TSMEX_002613 [Taenia solium]|eukprot:TsM_000736300 transcript=TsM_000736300 gene=TsM_000736300